MTYESLNTVLYELTMSLHGVLATQRHLLFRVSHPGFKDMVPTHADDYRNALGIISQCQSRLEGTMQSLIHQRIANSTHNSAANGMYFSPSLNRISTNINSDLDNAVDQLVGRITDTEEQPANEPIEPAGDDDNFDGNA